MEYTQDSEKIKCTPSTSPPPPHPKQQTNKQTNKRTQIVCLLQTLFLRFNHPHYIQTNLFNVQVYSTWYDKLDIYPLKWFCLKVKCIEIRTTSVHHNYQSKKSIRLILLKKEKCLAVLIWTSDQFCLSFQLKQASQTTTAMHLLTDNKKNTLPSFFLIYS